MTLNAALPMITKLGYTSHAVRTDKDNEYSAFAQVTHLLRRASDPAAGAARFAAIHRNNDLWTILAADLAHPDNALPQALKASLYSLAMFSIRHGHAAMRGGASLDALIDVNMAMMKGLRQEAAA